MKSEIKNLNAQLIIQRLVGDKNDLKTTWLH